MTYDNSLDEHETAPAEKFVSIIFKLFVDSSHETALAQCGLL
jgi:hypothetical protein